LGWTWGNAIANDQGKQIGAYDAEHTADRCSDQPLEADQPQSPFKDDDGEAEQRAGTGCVAGTEAKRLKEIASDCNKNNEYKTYDELIHRALLPANSGPRASAAPALAIEHGQLWLTSGLRGAYENHNAL